MLNEDTLSKSDIKDLIKKETDSLINSQKFDKKIKDISAKILSDLFKTLWQKKNFWETDLKR